MTDDGTDYTKITGGSIGNPIIVNLTADKLAEHYPAGGPGGRFPRWKDPSCPHPPPRQFRDGRGVLCQLCGVLRVLA